MSSNASSRTAFVSRRPSRSVSPYGVLRHRQDAEDVAQEAFAKAYRSFNQLRDRDRFRAWLVRMTWRLAIDRWRSDRRRSAREQSCEMACDGVERRTWRPVARTAAQL